MSSTNKQPTKSDKRRILDFLEDMQWLFGVQNFDRGLHYARDDEGKVEGERPAAAVHIDESYQRIEITIYPCFWNHSRKKQAEYLLHEFCHYITHPLASLADNLMAGKLQTQEHRTVAVERTTSTVANFVDMFLCNKLSFAKKGYNKYFAPVVHKKKRHAKK